MALPPNKTGNTGTIDIGHARVDVFKGMVGIIDPFLRISAGDIPGVSFVTKFGYNPDIGTAEESIWDAGGLYKWIQTASVLDIQSTSVNDANAGTGAWTVTVQGLDSSGLELDEVVTLAGVATVQTTNQFSAVHRMFVNTAGSNDGAVGTITAEISGTVHASIDNGNNQTLMATYTVPSDKTGYIAFGKTSVSSGKDVTIKFYGRLPGGVPRVLHVVEINSANYDYFFKIPLPVPAGTEVEVRATSSASGTAVSAVFDIVLIDNAA